MNDFLLMVKPRLGNSGWTYVSLSGLPSLLSPTPPFVTTPPVSTTPYSRPRLPSKRLRSQISPELAPRVNKARYEQTFVSSEYLLLTQQSTSSTATTIPTGDLVYTSSSSSGCRVVSSLIEHVRA